MADSADFGLFLTPSSGNFKQTANCKRINKEATARNSINNVKINDTELR